MSLSIHPFSDKYIDAAAQLLAARHRRDRQFLPHLPQRFEGSAAAKIALEAVWAKPWTSGSAALINNELVGYLLGSARFDQHSGRTVWVSTAGYALADDIDVEVMRDLYAAAGPTWLEIGCFDHYAMISVADRPLLDAWYSLSFGQQHAYGLCRLADVSIAPVPPSSDIVVRQAEATDGHHMEKLCYITGEHQFHAPTWAPTPVEIMAGRPENYRGVATDDEATTWLAFQEMESSEEAVGFQVYYEAEPEVHDLYVPDSCIELPAAGTLAEARGKGVGLALTIAGFTHAKEAGYTYCLTDWRTTNLQSSRFWPRRGFEPVVYRLHRRVDERILWANRIGK